MMKKNCTMPASVLASVLVVSTLILTGMLSVMCLWDNYLITDAGFRYRWQQQSNLSSAFIRYCRDSTMAGSLSADGDILLFPGDESSRVRIRKQRWGLYEVVKVTTGEGKWSSCRLVGRASEGVYGASLYVPENNRALSLSGDSFLEGTLYLPRNGIIYPQVRSDFFRGELIAPERLLAGGREFPPFAPEVTETVRDIFAVSGGERIDGNESMAVDFDLPVCRMAMEGELTAHNLRGHIIICSEGRIYIDSGNSLRHVIVVGRTVEIGDGFTGDIQVFARDTILLGNGVRLEAGSGLWVGGELPGRLISLGEDCEIDGYVVVNGCPPSGEKYIAHYRQPCRSKVKGLVYVDGNADIHGIVAGSLYLREACNFTREGYYPGVLYQLALFRDPEAAYPLLMSGAYERRVVRWLD